VLKRRTWKLLLTVHIASSAGWLGVAYVYLVFALTGTPVGRLDVVAWIPVGSVALVSGLLLGLGTRWGLVRYWWVLAKLVLNCAALVVPVLTRRAGEVLDPAIASVVVLTTATVLSTYKPFGRVRRRARSAAAAPSRSGG